MRISAVFVVLGINVLIARDGFAQEKDPNISEYVEFQNSDFCETIPDADKETCFTQAQKWRIGAWESIKLLPFDFLKRYGSSNNGKKIIFAFRYSPANALAQVFDNKIYFPILPSGYNPHLNREETMFYVLHELAHIDLNMILDFSGLIGPEPFPTEYAEKNVFEDFADSFAIYIVYPEYLKNNFPKRYRFMRTLLRQEYEQLYPTPQSMIVRAEILKEKKKADELKGR